MACLLKWDSLTEVAILNLLGSIWPEPFELRSAGTLPDRSDAQGTRGRRFSFFEVDLMVSSSAERGRMILAISFFILAVVFVSGCGPFSRPQRGKIIETWEATNGSFKVRISAYDEQGSYPAPGGAYYIFQSAIKGSDSWNEIITFRHDDPVAIPRDHIHFVNEQVGYVFMGWLYAVTTDAGRTWSVWDASKDPALSKTYNYNLIREVSISANGIGRILLNLTGDTEEELKTEDYGRHWTK